MKLRLLVSDKCNRACPGCCNNDWDLKSLPTVENFKNFSEILLTGGEPMLSPQRIRTLITEIRKENNCPIYIYTAKVDDLQEILSVLFFSDGITLTLHDQSDVFSFWMLNEMLPSGTKKSLNLNVFNGVVLPEGDDIDFGKWKIKTGIEWKKDCPLPEDEVFMRL